MKFNSNAKAKPAANYEGAKAYKLTPEMELYSAVATSLLSDKHYEAADERLLRIQSLLKEVNPVFAAKLAIYARKQMNLRSVPVALVTELAKLHNGDDLVSKTIAQVVQRPDEIMELLACYQLFNKRTNVKKLNRLSKQVQKGLAAAFNKFDEYQFAKYNRNTDVKLKDALFLVHPKAKDNDQQALFNKIVKDELAIPYTWETELSALGQLQLDEAEKAKAVTARWEELIDSKKLGYMALLRNLRNILQADVSSAHIEKVAAYLSNEQAVLQSKQMPFRFLSAWKEVKGIRSGYTNYLLDTLEKAIAASAKNLQGFDLDTRVVIACDVSGSMRTGLSTGGSIWLYDIGLLMGMLLQSVCSNVITGLFGDTWKTIAVPGTGILSNVELLYQRSNEVGLATNGYLVLADLTERKYVADKVMLFTDVQMWDSNTNNVSVQNTISAQWKRYKEIAPDAKLYLFDLAGYGHSPVRMLNDDVCLIAGWSDKIFAMLEAIEKSGDAISVIENIEI